VVGKSIRFGLSAIKNVGSNVIELIVKERKEKGRFADFHDFCRRASSTVLNKKTVESLIKAGVFDSLRCSRKFLLENCENIVDEAAKMKKRAETGQFSLFDETENEAGYSFDHKYPEREEILKEAIQEEYSSRMLLNFEKEILGLYISGHPLADYEDLVSGFTTVDNLDREKDKSTQVIAGVVVSIKQIMTRSNQPMYFLTLEDLTDSIEVIIFPAVLEKFRAIIEEDKVLWIKGKLDKKEDQTKFIAIEIEDLKKMRGRKKTVSSADDMEEKIIVENPAGNAEDNSTGFYNNRSTGTDTGHVSEDTGELARNRLILKINKDVLDRDVINKLYEIIGKNPGSITVELKITNGNNNEIEKSYSFPQSYGIDLNNSLFEQLRSQFGEFISWEMPPDIK
jgi:DNA polymerase III alpha subunit